MTKASRLSFTFQLRACCWPVPFTTNPAPWPYDAWLLPGNGTTGTPFNFFPYVGNCTLPCSNDIILFIRVVPNVRNDARELTTSERDHFRWEASNREIAKRIIAKIVNLVSRRSDLALLIYENLEWSFRKTWIHDNIDISDFWLFLFLISFHFSNLLNFFQFFYFFKFLPNLFSVSFLNFYLIFPISPEFFYYWENMFSSMSIVTSENGVVIWNGLNSW